MLQRISSFTGSRRLLAEAEVLAKKRTLIPCVRTALNTPLEQKLQGAPIWLAFGLLATLAAGTITAAFGQSNAEQPSHLQQSGSSGFMRG